MFSKFGWGLRVIFVMEFLGLLFLGFVDFMWSIRVFIGWFIVLDSKLFKDNFMLGVDYDIIGGDSFCKWFRIIKMLNFGKLIMFGFLVFRMKFIKGY